MIKFTLTAASGKRVLGIGLSDENIKRLKEKDPILFDAAAVGIDNLDVLIMHGETEDSIREELRKNFKIGKEVEL